MKYLGSKNKLSKYLVPVIESYLTADTEFYLEPFVGGANLIDKISFDRKLGSDINRYLIALLIYVQDLSNELPESISESEYNAVKFNPSGYPDWYVGLVGFCATFGSKWFGGYARGFKSDGVTPRDMPNEAIRNLEEQRIHLSNISFSCHSYDFYNSDYEDEFISKGPIISNSVIYCDIPYRGTTEYKTGGFDYVSFYNWCVKMKSYNNIVLISEYSMPSNLFDCILEIEHSTSVSTGIHKHSSRTEKLFIVK